VSHGFRDEQSLKRRCPAIGPEFYQPAVGPSRKSPIRFFMGNATREHTFPPQAHPMFDAELFQPAGFEGFGGIHEPVSE